MSTHRATRSASTAPRQAIASHTDAMVFISLLDGVTQAGGVVRIDGEDATVRRDRDARHLTIPSWSGDSVRVTPRDQISRADRIWHIDNGAVAVEMFLPADPSAQSVRAGNVADDARHFMTSILPLPKAKRVVEAWMSASRAVAGVRGEAHVQAIATMSEDEWQEHMDITTGTMQRGDMASQTGGVAFRSIAGLVRQAARRGTVTPHRPYTLPPRTPAIMANEDVMIAWCEDHARHVVDTYQRAPF